MAALEDCWKSCNRIIATVRDTTLECKKCSAWQSRNCRGGNLSRLQKMYRIWWPHCQCVWRSMPASLSSVGVKRRNLLGDSHLMLHTITWPAISQKSSAPGPEVWASWTKLWGPHQTWEVWRRPVRIPKSTKSVWLWDWGMLFALSVLSFLSPGQHSLLLKKVKNGWWEGCFCASWRRVQLSLAYNWEWHTWLDEPAVGPSEMPKASM